MAPYLFVVVGVAEVAMWMWAQLRNAFNVKEAAIFITLIGIVCWTASMQLRGPTEIVRTVTITVTATVPASTALSSALE